MAQMKICNKCKVEKPISEFAKRSNRPCGIKSQCKTCHAKYKREWCAANNEHINIWRRQYSAKNKEKIYANAKKHKYGLSDCQYKQLDQINSCQLCDSQVCGRDKHIDHCHGTGTVRGILCNRCNTALGGFEWLNQVAGINQVLQYLNLEERKLWNIRNSHFQNQ